MARVELKNLTKRWGDVVGVDRQSLEIHDREFLVLLGPSGCGKTTTMRMIAGLEEPSAGEIWIGDRMVNDDLPKDRDVAMVFQNYGLYPHMTVFENIAYPLRVRSTPKSEIAPRVERAAEQVELGQYLERKPKELSGGQRQRVALARAIVRTPKVFLMDEPLSNLDAKLRVSMRAELKHLSRELRITTVYVTHDQVEAMTLADRVAVMRDGVIQQLGTPQEIYGDPANMFVAGFIGSPPMNLVEGSIRNGAFVAAEGNAQRDGIPGSDGSERIEESGCGAKLVRVGGDDRDRVVLGIRADDIRVTEPGQGDLDASIYAFENTGDATMLTVRIGRQRVIAKGARHLSMEQGDKVGIALDADHLYLFDPDTGDRVPA